MRVACVKIFYPPPPSPSSRSLVWIREIIEFDLALSLCRKITITKHSRTSKPWKLQTLEMWFHFTKLYLEQGEKCLKSKHNRKSCIGTFIISTNSYSWIQRDLVSKLDRQAAQKGLNVFTRRLYFATLNDWLYLFQYLNEKFESVFTKYNPITSCQNH